MSLASAPVRMLSPHTPSLIGPIVGGGLVLGRGRDSPLPLIPALIVVAEVSVSATPPGSPILRDTHRPGQDVGRRATDSGPDFRGQLVGLAAG